MEFCLKPAWTMAARIGAQEAGFKRVRGHGILIRLGSADNIHVGTSPNWNFSVIDQIYDTVLACGMEPIVELDFMPTSMQSNGDHAPPKDPAVWQSFIAALATNLENRYTAAKVRKWYWEVWNEPDYSGFWVNTDMNAYYSLFNYARNGVRSVDTNIIIGGPATTNVGPITAFLTNCPGTRFLSNHQYGGGAGATANVLSIRDDNRSRSGVIGTKNLLSMNTEFNSCYSGQGGNTSPNCVSMDNHKNASFLTKAMKLILDDYANNTAKLPDVLSYWTISDCFDEWGSSGYMEGNNLVPFGAVFGLINYQGVRKAAFNAYRLMHMMGTTRLSLTGGSGDNDGVDGFATVKADTSQVAILVYSYYNNLTTTGADETVNLTINNLPFTSGRQVTMHHYRIDSLHSNPYAVWLRLNRPTTPTTAQWDSIRAHQVLEQIETPSTITYNGAAINKSFAMPRWSVSLITYDRLSTSATNGAGQHVIYDFLEIAGKVLRSNIKGNTAIQIAVFGANGQLVRRFSTQQRSYDLGGVLTKGLYVVRAEAAGLHLVKKILVQ
jgi:xylan 1,4-beta-xylosidase